jgi:hypothetical protein
VAVDAFVERARVRSALLPVLQLTARVDALVGVVAFGLVLAVFHRGDVAAGIRPPTATEWAVINLAVGVASGVLFHLFLGPRDTGSKAGADSRLFVALAGAIVVASGASYYLDLSPLYTNLVLGFVLANSGGAHRDVSRLLLATERPVYLALLVFAGAAWSPESVDLLFLALAFVLIRLAARLFGGRVAGEHVAPPKLRTTRLPRGLLAQGGLAVAIAVNYTQVRPDLNPHLVLTATLLSVLLFEIVAAGRERPWSRLSERRTRASRRRRPSRPRAPRDPAARGSGPADRWGRAPRAPAGSDRGGDRAAVSVPLRHSPAHRRHLRSA